MTLSNSIKTCFFKKYFCFDGRASRSEYTWFIIFSLFVYFVSIVVFFIFTAYNEDTYKSSIIEKSFEACILFIFLSPLIGVSIRRLHDIGLSGKWYLINFVPCIGQIFFILLCVIKGKDSENIYGATCERENIFNIKDLNLILLLIITSCFIMSTSFLMSTSNYKDSLKNQQKEFIFKLRDNIKKESSNERLEFIKEYILKEDDNISKKLNKKDITIEEKIDNELLRIANDKAYQFKEYQQICEKIEIAKKNIRNFENIWIYVSLALVIYIALLMLYLIFKKYIIKNKISCKKYKSQRIGLIIIVFSIILILISIFINNYSFSPIKHFGDYLYANIFLIGILLLIIGVLILLMIPQNILSWINKGE